MGPSLIAGTCVAVLQDIQNSDGGWGYSASSESRVEPTCWALRVLKSPAFDVDQHALVRAREFLLKNQTKDGYWTAAPEMQTANWVTSLACAVLSDEADAKSAVSAGLTWLCADYPLDSSWWMRYLRRLRRDRNVSEMNDTYRGWGWTPRTSSWVEPTAFALMALEECQASETSAALNRRELAVKLLYDRMCPGGGWNCGNPRVYGVAGQPLVLPTAWALLALRHYPDHESKNLSLAWLREEVSKIESPASLAAATLCLEAYDEPVPPGKFDLAAISLDSLLQDGVHVLAWACLALDANRSWPAKKGVAV